MHELAITRNIVAIVAEAARGRRVGRVTVEIGKLSGVMSEAVAFCFDAVAENTPVAGAVLDLQEIEGRARCLSCGRVFTTETLFARCACGSNRVERLRGEELNVKSMELVETA